MNVRKPINLDDVMDFGKYKISPTTLQQVIDKDVGYVTWIMETAGFELSNDAYKYYIKVKGE